MREVLLACGRFLSTSARRIDCQVLAEELAPLEVAWDATDPHAQRLNAQGQVIAELSSPAGEARVIPTGGGFFFSPAKSVLETL